MIRLMRSASAASASARWTTTWWIDHLPISGAAPAGGRRWSSSRDRPRTARAVWSAPRSYASIKVDWADAMGVESSVSVRGGGGGVAGDDVGANLLGQRDRGNQ